MTIAAPVLAVSREVQQPQPLQRASHSASVCLVVLSLALIHVVNGVYVGLERPAPEGWTVLSPFLTSMSVLAWFWSYSKIHRIPWVVDMAWFVLVAWVIIVPYYVIRREGRRGLARIGLFCLTYLAAWAVGLAVRVWIRVLST